MLSGLAFWYPTIPETQPTILNCLGRQELFFEFDYFTPGGHRRSKKYCQIDNVLGKYACMGAIFVSTVLGANVMEIFFNINVLIAVKNQTRNTSSMLSRTAFESRKRYGRRDRI